jgi:membrane-bound metal-dependent hydrolase YbcI (DUF457 family)
LSWAAHDLEPYAFQRHFGRRIAFIPLLIGSYAPDMLTKWFVYGIHVFGIGLKAEQPQTFHRGWPGVGFTHSLTFGLLIAFAIWLVSKNRVYAYSFLIGHWAHALSDIGDTMGTMLLFPFTTRHFTIGTWAYAGQTGRYTDAAAYFSGFGFVWDGVWVVMALLSWRVITRDYFYSTVLAADGAWSWLSARFPAFVVLALYRGSYFYGLTRWSAWLIWAHVLNDYSFDLSWGGPYWVEAATASVIEATGPHLAGAGAD